MMKKCQTDSFSTWLVSFHIGALFLNTSFLLFLTLMGGGALGSCHFSAEHPL